MRPTKKTKIETRAKEEGSRVEPTLHALRDLRLVGNAFSESIKLGRVIPALPVLVFRHHMIWPHIHGGTI